ncbi:MAG: exopolysaccharide biosynthesis protein [Verrucomicrobia bacterium]|nr:exopolysaccharide biosynthesis protein [Verrucomicrobiota bacterium]
MRPPHGSKKVARLIAAFAERAVRLRNVMEVMPSRGYTVLLILLVFPSCTPIPLPGFSTGFGAVVPIKETLSRALTHLSAPCD